MLGEDVVLDTIRRDTANAEGVQMGEQVPKDMIKLQNPACNRQSPLEWDNKRLYGSGHFSEGFLLLTTEPILTDTLPPLDMSALGQATLFPAPGGLHILSPLFGSSLPGRGQRVGSHVASPSRDFPAPVVSLSLL